MDMDVAKQYKLPALMIVVGVLILAVIGYSRAGEEAIGPVLSAIAMMTVINVVLGLFGLMITASILGVSFGPISSATLKLAATVILPLAIAEPIPYFGWLVAMVLYFAMLAWLFDLDPNEAMICAIVLWLIRFLAGWFMVMMLATG